MSENNTISVTVKFFADLRQFGPERSQVQLSKGSTIESVLNKFNVPWKKTNLIIMVNSLPHRTRDLILQNGDIVAVFPLIAGG
jgi:molybdopterin converting factor small subunit